MDVFATSACGHFLAAGLHDGTAQLVHVASRRILASFPLVSPPSASLPLVGVAAAEKATFSAVFFEADGPGRDRLCLLAQAVFLIRIKFERTRIWIRILIFIPIRIRIRIDTDHNLYL